MDVVISPAAFASQQGGTDVTLGMHEGTATTTTTTPGVDMTGRVCLITGATSGIGKAAALGLANMGATVVLTARNQTKGMATQSEIRQALGGAHPPDNVDLMLVDLGSLDSVRQLVEKFSGKYQRLHVLINNAGLILGSRTVTQDGFEMTFEVNYLSHFLLTNLLLETLKASAPARILNVSSSGHTRGHIDFDDLQEEHKKHSAMGSYAQSKLAQILFTKELAERLRGAGVTVNAIHPGVVATNWGRQSAGPLGVGLRLIRPFSLNPTRGADTVIYLASSPDVADVTGKYFSNRKEQESSQESHDMATARRLWQVSAALTGLPQN